MDPITVILGALAAAGGQVVGDAVKDGYGALRAMIVRKFGASGLMATPTEGDIVGSAKEDIERYLQSAALTGPERVRLFRLAWDIAGSAFGSRQVLYERFFASDPLTRARAIASIYPKKEVMDRVLEFLGRDDDAE